MSEAVYKEFRKAMERVREKAPCARCGEVLNDHPWTPDQDPNGNFFCADRVAWDSDFSFIPVPEAS